VKGVYLVLSEHARGVLGRRGLAEISSLALKLGDLGLVVLGCTCSLQSSHDLGEKVSHDVSECVINLGDVVAPCLGQQLLLLFSGQLGHVREDVALPVTLPFGLNFAQRSIGARERS
jgi:hypothetical protein